MMSYNLQLCYFVLGTLVCFACVHNVKTPERNDDCGNSRHASVMCAASRPRTHATADGAAPLAAPLAKPRGVPPSPTLSWAGAGSPTPAHARGNAPLRASLPHTARAHACTLSARSHASAPLRTVAVAPSNTHTRAPPRLHALTRTPPTAAAGDARTTGAPQANPLYTLPSPPPPAAALDAACACVRLLAAAHTRPIAHATDCSTGAPSARTPCARTGPELKSLAHIRAATRTHSLCLRRRQQVPGAGGNPPRLRRSGTAVHTRCSHGGQRGHRLPRYGSSSTTKGLESASPRWSSLAGDRCAGDPAAEAIRAHHTPHQQHKPRLCAAAYRVCGACRHGQRTRRASTPLRRVWVRLRVLVCACASVCVWLSARVFTQVRACTPTLTPAYARIQAQARSLAR